MEAPSWIFKDKTYFQHILKDDIMIFFFSDFEHNWYLFQFMTPKNIYYFNLNKNYKSQYNFDIIYKIYNQKFKHILINDFYFILNTKEQEKFINNLEIKFNYVFIDNLQEHFIKNNINIDINILNSFPTHSFNDAIELMNKKIIPLFNFNDEELNIIIKKNSVIRKKLNSPKKISFFGASVTGQNYSYVDNLIKLLPNVEINKLGYSGCHINQALWLVDDVLEKKPDICILEWTTSVYKNNIKLIEEFLAIIINKLKENNIEPIILYLYKKDISDYKCIIESYEKIANYYKINSFHLYNVVNDLSIDNSFLKDNCHTNIDGSKLYGRMIKIFLDNIFQEMPFNTLYINSNFNNIKILNLEKNLNQNLEFEIFNGKKYFKVDDKIIIKKDKIKIIAFNIIYYKNNGYVLFNDIKYQTWDKNCYYKRSGYINLDIDISDEIKIEVLQDKFETNECKYENKFPDNKYLLISEIIYI